MVGGPEIAAAGNPGAAKAAADGAGTTGAAVRTDAPGLDAPPTTPGRVAAAAAALPTATGGVGGGERLPADGNRLPTAPAPAGLPPAALRAGLAPALLSAAAKSWPLPPEFRELACPPALCCAGSDAIGVCETGGVAFISLGIASHVPDEVPPMHTTRAQAVRLNFNTRVAHPSNPAPSIQASQRFMPLDTPNLADACSAR